MAPTRKPRSVNKRLSQSNKVSPSEDGESANRNSPRKRKISDKLGPRWSENEQTRFYEAYRKYGKDWKKVAAAVRSRTVDMVEALYKMSRAYLSLPEGTASVVGLKAMMTDYYTNLDGSDTDQEINNGAGTSRKPQKRPRVKVQPSTTKPSEGNFLSPPKNVSSAYGCLSLLSEGYPGGNPPRAVGKRTPRFPISYNHDNSNSNKYFSPTRQRLKMKGNSNNDEVAHEVAVVLAEASHKVCSPQVSRTPNKKTESDMSTPSHRAERKYSELETARSKPAGSDMDEEDLEGSMVADTGEFSRYRAYQMDSRNVGEQFQKARKHSGKRLHVAINTENQLDEIKEACSGTEESQRFGVGKFEAEVTDQKSSRKRSKKVLFSEDEESVVDALQALANWPLSAPAPEENESAVQVKDEIDDHVDESGSQYATPKCHLRDRRKSSGVKVKASQTISRHEVAASKTLKLDKVSVLDDSAEPGGKMESNNSSLKAVRKKPKPVGSKIRKNEAQVDINQGEYQEVEARDADKKSMSKIKRSSHSSSPTLARNHEDSLSNDPRREGSDSAQSSLQVPIVNQVNLPANVRSRRKMNLKKPQMLNNLKFPENTSGSETNGPLSRCLSNYQARRWCIFEWFYSAIDYPWFAKREFVEYLYHVGLGHVPRLTRVEWGVIRSSLGKPRRFSDQFLKEEKEKLNQYRNSVRTHYTELREGIREGLPTDLARPLSVGQRVIAIHPKTREIHDGNVLTVDRSRCRVQFDRPELGVEFVMDVDCMPLNAFENMPSSLARHTVSVDKLFENLNDLTLNWQAKDLAKYPPAEALENVNSLPHMSPPAYPMGVLKQTKVGAADANIQARVVASESATYSQTIHSPPSTLAQIQAKEADVQALAELTRALDKKEAVVLELRRLNDDVIENQKDGNSSLKDSEPFKKQYAAVLVQLNEANEQVSSALQCLRQRNTYQGQILAWARPNGNSVDPSGLVNSFDNSAGPPQESGSQVNDIIESSKIKARTMVDAAMQAMSTLSRSDNSIKKIEEAIDYVNDWLPSDDSCIPTALETKVNNASEREEAEIPSELIARCVATLLMIQKCTERQFPPADVAQILDSAVTGLQPCCSQNLPYYAEIQKCMGIIRNQILALVPT